MRVEMRDDVLFHVREKNIGTRHTVTTDKMADSQLAARTFK